jgi:hypothetical protein
MNIELSKKDYRNLLDMLATAEWVFNATQARGGTNPKTQKYETVMQKLLSFAKHHDCDDLVEYDGKSRKYYFNWDHDESGYMELIEDYENDVFWDELSERLASRDLANILGEEKFLKQSRDEAFIRHGRLEDRYNEEFERNGLKNVTVGGVGLLQPVDMNVPIEMVR